jgi:hypothetical protein
MGLQHSKYIFNKIFPQTYTRISQIKTTQETKNTPKGIKKVITGDCIVHMYPNKTHSDMGSPMVETQKITLTLDKNSPKNFYSQAYTHLKTLNEWKYAEDVLENE